MMNIESKVIAYLQWNGEASTEQVESAVTCGAGAVYKALRRLSLLGTVSKRLVKKYQIGSKVAYWRLSPGYPR